MNECLIVLAAFSTAPNGWNEHPPAASAAAVRTAYVVVSQVLATGSYLWVFVEAPVHRIMSLLFSMTYLAVADG